MRMSGIATATSNILWECRRMNKNVRSRPPGRPPRDSVSTRRRRSSWAGATRTATVWTMHTDQGQPPGGRRRLTEAVKKAKTYSFTKKVEVEVVVLDQAKEAAAAGADIIMLDNMSPKDAEECYRPSRASIHGSSSRSLAG